MRRLGKDVAATDDADDVALVIMDQADWHVSKRLRVPSNLRLVFLPPYSPELAPHWTLRSRTCGTGSGATTPAIAPLPTTTTCSTESVPHGEH